MVRSRKPDQNLTKNIYKENFDCFTIGIIHLRPRFVKKKEPFLLSDSKKDYHSASHFGLLFFTGSPWLQRHKKNLGACSFPRKRVGLGLLYRVKGPLYSHPKCFTPSSVISAISGTFEIQPPRVFN